jgi:predicted amino acid-binding ACT domain protein
VRIYAAAPHPLLTLSFPQVAQFSEVLHKHGAQMLDIEQAACGTHSTFTLNMLVQGGKNSDAMVSDMLLSSQQGNIQMSVVVVEQSSIRGDDEPEVRHALTLLKPDMGFDVIAKVAAEATNHGFNIQEIDRLSPLIPSQLGSEEPSLSAVELILGETPTTNVEDFKASLATMQGELACDREWGACARAESQPWPRPRRGD